MTLGKKIKINKNKIKRNTKKQAERFELFLTVRAVVHNGYFSSPHQEGYLIGYLRNKDFGLAKE